MGGENTPTNEEASGLPPKEDFQGDPENGEVEFSPEPILGAARGRRD